MLFPSMEIETTRLEKAVVVKVAGRMDAGSAPEFEKACEDCLRGGAERLVVDLSALDYISSAGLRSFLLVAKSLQEKGGKMLLCGMRGLVKEVFDMTRISSLFASYEGPESALADL
ncbi:MAG: STAS domain-containing protein [Bryobacteraceae bacterium]|nr:STAS domain-containing protein [Bryobacteraceae bacterium]